MQARRRTRARRRARTVASAGRGTRRPRARARWRRRSRSRARSRPGTARRTTRPGAASLARRRSRCSASRCSSAPNTSADTLAMTSSATRRAPSSTTPSPRAAAAGRAGRTATRRSAARRSRARRCRGSTRRPTRRGPGRAGPVAHRGRPRRRRAATAASDADHERPGDHPRHDRDPQVVTNEPSPQDLTEPGTPTSPRNSKYVVVVGVMRSTDCVPALASERAAERLALALDAAVARATRRTKSVAPSARSRTRGATALVSVAVDAVAVVDPVDELRPARTRERHLVEAPVVAQEPVHRRPELVGAVHDDVARLGLGVDAPTPTSPAWVRSSVALRTPPTSPSSDQHREHADRGPLARRTP